MTNIESINLIARNPKVSGGRPCTSGSGLNVSDIVMAKVYNLQTPEKMSFLNWFYVFAKLTQHMRELIHRTDALRQIECRHILRSKELQDIRVRCF